VRTPRLGNRRVASQPTRKGAIPVRVATETETETVPGQDADAVSAKTTEQLTIEIDEPEDAVDPVDEVESEDASSDDAHIEDAEDVTPPARWRRIKWSRLFAFGVLPALALVIAAGAGFLKWQDGWVRGSKVAGIESVAAAKDSTIALLSYQPDTVDKELKAARDHRRQGAKSGPGPANRQLQRLLHATDPGRGDPRRKKAAHLGGCHRSCCRFGLGDSKTRGSAVVCRPDCGRRR